VVCEKQSFEQTIHRVEPDPAEMAERHGADTTVSAWHRRLVCSQCGSKAIDFVLTGAKP